MFHSKRHSKKYVICTINLRINSLFRREDGVLISIRKYPIASFSFSQFFTTIISNGVQKCGSFGRLTSADDGRFFGCEYEYDGLIGV